MKHYRTANFIKHGHDKKYRISIYTSNAVPCETNEAAHQTLQTKWRSIVHIMIFCQPKALVMIIKSECTDLITWETLLNEI